MLFPQPFGFVVTRSGKKFCRWRRKANTRASCATCCIPKTRAGCTVPASRVTVAVRLTGPCGGTCNMGDKNELSQFSKEEVQDFFRKVQESKENKQGRLQWKTIRSTLVNYVTQRQILSFKTDVECAALPLSVYLAQGWEESVVKNCPSVYNETLGVETYKVPVQRDTWTQTFERVVERVLAQEKAASLGKKKKGLPADSGDELDLAVPVAAGKAEKNSEKNAEKKAAAEQKKICASNLKVSGQAAKALGPLTNALTALDRLEARVGKPKSRWALESWRRQWMFETAWRVGRKQPEKPSTTRKLRSKFQTLRRRVLVRCLSRRTASKLFSSRTRQSKRSWKLFCLCRSKRRRKRRRKTVPKSQRSQLRSAAGQRPLRSVTTSGKCSVFYIDTDRLGLFGTWSAVLLRHGPRVGLFL